MEYGTAVIIDDLAAVPLTPATSPIYQVPIERAKLFEDPTTGAVHYLVRYPPGLDALAHRHTHAHTIVVISGRLSVNGVEIGPGTYAHLPGGEVMRHTTAGDSSCLFVIVFDGPLDVEVIADRGLDNDDG